MKNVLLGVGFLIVSGLFIARLNRARTQSLRDSGEYPPPGQGTMADVERFVRNGRKIDAIKLYREIHGVDLKTAKDYVDQMAAGQ